MDLVIAVTGPSFKPHAHKGGLLCVTPDEVRIPYCRAIAQTVHNYSEAAATGQTPVAIADLTEKIAQWRHHALTCTFEFKVLGSDDAVYFTVTNQREKLVTD